MQSVVKYDPESWNDESIADRQRFHKEQMEHKKKNQSLQPMQYQSFEAYEVNNK